MKLISLASACVLTLGLCAACGDQTKSGEVEASESTKSMDLKGPAKEAIDSSKAAFEKTKADYKKMLDEKLADLDEHIAELQAKASEATGIDKSDLDQLVAKLETQRKLAGEKLAQWKQAGAESWQNFTADLDRMVKDLDAAAHKALEEEK